MADAALLILHNQEQRILLQHRDVGAPKHPGYWGFFGGALQPQETPEEAVRREAREELEYDLTKPTLLTTQKIIHDGKKYYFIERYSVGKGIQLREGQAFDWFTLSDAAALNIVPHHRQVLAHVGAFMKNLSNE